MNHINVKAFIERKVAAMRRVPCMHGYTREGLVAPLALFLDLLIEDKNLGDKLYRECFEVTGTNVALGMADILDEDFARKVFGIYDAMLVDFSQEYAQSVSKSCNLHSDCSKASEESRSRGKRIDHCHDECCEDCFGS